MRFHVVALPHTNTTGEFPACAFNEKVRKFCVMMKMLGHTVYLYAGEHNEAPCDEHIVCISEVERVACLNGKHYTHASFDYSLPHWVKFNQFAIDGIRERIRAQDFICVIGGLAHKQVADAFPANMTVEFGIGYPGTFSKYRIWESYAWMHTCYGAASNNQPQAIDGQWFDAVIPSYFEVERFPFVANPSEYYLFMGRVTERKGYMVAVEACKRAGKKLIVAGPDGRNCDDYMYVGEVGPQARGELMSYATALFCPTIYIEPFGSVAAEAQLCGTPVLCTDWGAMTETVEHGHTGFRCRTLSEFIQGMKDVKHLHRHYIRERAVSLWSLENVAKQYDRHFKRLMLLWNEGWYEEAA